SGRRARSTAATCSRSATGSTSASAGARTRRAPGSCASCSRRAGRRSSSAGCGRASPEVRGDGAARRIDPRPPPLVPEALRNDFVAVPEKSGAHVVFLRGGKVMLAADCPRTAELVAARGYDPVVVDISEFQKREGCVTCLSVRLRHATYA